MHGNLIRLACCVFYSSPLTSPGSVEFVFNVLELDATHGRSYSRKGVCTGWMEKFEAVSEEKTEIADQMENCSLSSTIQVKTSAFLYPATQ